MEILIKKFCSTIYVYYFC
uniref:Uncharacterized protein n=1 Tax=Romanomermis culicivorax TaxID=13658 RepID=A0A915L4Z0_ROMCU